MKIEKYKEYKDLEQAYNQILFGWQEVHVGIGIRRKREERMREAGKTIQEEKKEYKRYRERSC